MPERTAEVDRLNWRPPLYAAVGACVVFLPIMVYGSADVAVILYTFGAAPIIGILLFVVVAVRWPQRQQGLVATRVRGELDFLQCSATKKYEPRSVHCKAILG